MTPSRQQKLSPALWQTLSLKLPLLHEQEDPNSDLMQTPKNATSSVMPIDHANSEKEVDEAMVEVVNAVIEEVLLVIEVAEEEVAEVVVIVEKERVSEEKVADLQIEIIDPILILETLNHQQEQKLNNKHIIWL
jgi:hypothetical protein